MFINKKLHGVSQLEEEEIKKIIICKHKVKENRREIKSSGKLFRKLEAKQTKFSAFEPSTK